MWLVTLVNNNTHRANDVCVIATFDGMKHVHAYLCITNGYHFEKAVTANHIEDDKDGIYSRDKDDSGIYLRLSYIPYITDLTK